MTNDTDKRNTSLEHTLERRYYGRCSYQICPDRHKTPANDLQSQKFMKRRVNIGLKLAEDLRYVKLNIVTHKQSLR